MNSLKYNQAEIPFYIVLLQIWIKDNDSNKFNSTEMIQFIQNKLNQGCSEIITILNGKSPGLISRSSKVNINYLTIFSDNYNTIPIECFNLFKKSTLILDNNKFILDFPTVSDCNFFLKWKGIWSINKYVYDGDTGPIKTVIEQAIEQKIIWELDSRNKVNPYRDSSNGTVSKATKQYGYFDNNNDLRTLINARLYIDFYDIFDPISGFLDEKSCIIKIENKIRQNKVIKELIYKNITFNKTLLDDKIKEIFF